MKSELKKNLENEFNYLNLNCVNKNIILTRSIFLRSIALIYLFAFLSLYPQIQGLWGDEGILPARILLTKIQEVYKEKAVFINFPTLLWYNETINRFFINLISFLQLNGVFSLDTPVDNSLYILCIIGIIISLGIVFNRSFAYNPIGFFLLWIIYLNFFIIGQVFMSFQWDIFLLETGFITIFLCPLGGLNVITPVDNLIFHLIRFLMFRFIYANGIVKITANCPSWLSFTALNYHFQSQPLPNFLSYYAHYMPDGIKKMLVAFTYFIEIYAPFMFFCFFRRLNILGGCIQFCFQIVLIFTGNYNFFNLLTIVVNLSNFDDTFLRTMIPSSLLNLFELDPLKELQLLIENDNKKIDSSKTKETGELTNENLDSKEHIDTSEQDEQIRDILKNKTLRNIANEDIELHKNKIIKNNPIGVEFLFFLNFIGIIVLVTFFYIYPIKQLLQGEIKLSEKDIQKVYNLKFLNFYMTFIFIYIFFTFVYDLLGKVKINLLSTISIENISKNKSNESFLKKAFNTILSIINMIKNIFFSFFFIFYFIHSVNIFYEGLDLKLVDKDAKFGFDKYFGQSLKFSELLFSRFRVNHSYGLFRVMTGLRGRPELEIKISNAETWETLNFNYKMSDDSNFKLKFNIPHQPRIDWQIWFSALARDVNSESWLVIMLGKILENNPVTLDLLGYHIDQKENFYKYSLFDRFTQNFIIRKDRKKINFVPKKIKIQLYNYYFSSHKEFADGKIWNKMFIRDFLPSIEKIALEGIFEMYGIPKIDEKRKILISTFQMIPIVDTVIIFAIIFYFIKFLWK